MAKIPVHLLISDVFRDFCTWPRGSCKICFCLSWEAIRLYCILQTEYYRSFFLSLIMHHFIHWSTTFIQRLNRRTRVLEFVTSLPKEFILSKNVETKKEVPGFSRKQCLSFSEPATYEVIVGVFVGNTVLCKVINSRYRRNVWQRPGPTFENSRRTYLLTKTCPRSRIVLYPEPPRLI